jgi:hypothetical protein
MIVAVGVAKERGQVSAAFVGRTEQGTAGLIVSWQRRKGQKVPRKAAFNSSRYQEAGKNIIVAVVRVVVK